MNKLALRCASVVALCGCLLPAGAGADGPPMRATSAPPQFSWSGLYFGAHLGGGVGTSSISDPFGSSIFGDDVRVTGPLAGVQLGYNWQFGSTVFGLETDVSWADMEGTNTCFAFSGFFISSNCRVEHDRFGTLTARLGLALGPSGRTLLYGKGGAAWLHENVAATLNNDPLGLFANQTSSSETKWGWTIGGGVEYAMTGSWSVKAEYDFLSFGNHSVPTTAGVLQTVVGPPLWVMVGTPPATASVSDDVHQFKLGVNYRFGGRDSPEGYRGPGPMAMPGWQLETGARYWHSWSRFQKDLPAGPVDTSLISRLTYDDMKNNSGEFFARLDTPIGVFVKGFVGGGSKNSGKMNDEDWCIFGFILGCDPTAVPYSNTLSSVSGNLGYATIDVGYDVWRGATYKVGGFIGYNYFRDKMEAVGCAQIANAFGPCSPALPTSVLVITESDRWESFRIGTSAEVKLAPRLRLVADAAYLPHVTFKGTDNHVLRTLIISESGDGKGVQLEATLAYDVTDRLSLGVGGRYWSMWTTSGDDAFNGVPIPRNDTYRTEIYGVMLQGSYKFGIDACCAAPLK
jgi:opacity protein-like surface antigen/outer membrane protease